MATASDQRAHEDLTPRHADVVFDAGPQLRKVRVVMWLAVACAIAGTWWGWSLALTFGLAPGDGGVLRPLPTRMAVGATVAGLGLLFASGMWLFGRQYIAEIRQGPGDDAITVRTTHLVGTTARTYAASQVRLGRRHEGRSSTRSLEDPFIEGIRVHAPWRAVHVPGRRIPLILDGQGWFKGLR